MALQDIEIIMADRDGIRYRNYDFYWLSYNFTNSIDNLTGTFSISYIDKFSKPRVDTGFYVQLRINNRTAFSGIVQRKEISINKNERVITLSGKDMSSLLVENYVSPPFKDYAGWIPSDIITDLINKTNFQMVE